MGIFKFMLVWTDTYVKNLRPWLQSLTWCIHVCTVVAFIIHLYSPKGMQKQNSLNAYIYP